VAGAASGAGLGLPPARSRTRMPSTRPATTLSATIGPR
jgi:hypothetical protein